MNETENIKQIARRVFEIESSAISSLSEKLDSNFDKAIDLLFNTKRVVVTGMGKAGHIGCKVAATLSSTGTPAFFMHPAEGIHGDLGMITPENVVIAFSNNGQTEEVLRIIPYLKHFQIPLIAVTGNPESELARNADAVLNISVKEEACPLGLAPTASTTSMLAMGDALAVALLEKRGFKKEDFALFHPGGALGKRLLIRVKDIMYKGKDIPIIHYTKTFREAIMEMLGKNLGAVLVVDDNARLVGIFTDGDMKRALFPNPCDYNTSIEKLMIRNPKSAHPDILAIKALDMMEQYNITVLPVTDENRNLHGLIHMHDIIKAGITT
ncbi:KpsF/GutQ family sugar-phosphate isomerase [Candidatus Sumerlaeota bacterium]|nr:KpsF/GutQ family sugar-phosphate isomerase [Candidatus Sumerlaeota bacterium]